MKKGGMYSLVLFLILPAAFGDGLVSVKDYFCRDGTYERPHFRTEPDGIRSHNLISWEKKRWVEERIVDRYFRDRDLQRCRERRTALRLFDADECLLDDLHYRWDPYCEIDRLKPYEDFHCAPILPPFPVSPKPWTMVIETQACTHRFASQPNPYGGVPPKIWVERPPQTGLTVTWLPARAPMASEYCAPTYLEQIDAEARIRVADELRQLGLPVNWRAYSFPELIDMESRIRLTKQLRAYGVPLDWRNHSFLELMDIESRVRICLALRKSGLNLDWRNHSFSELLEIETRVRSRGW